MPFSLNVFRTAYRTPALFLAAQGMTLESYASTSKSVDEEEACYSGSLVDGRFVGPDNSAHVADVDFALEATEDSLRASICRCDADDGAAGRAAVCVALAQNLVARLQAVKEMLNGAK